MSPTSLSQARGFLELDAPHKAGDMLEGLPTEERTHPDGLSLRLAICTALGKWEMGFEILHLLEPSGDCQQRQDVAGFCYAYARELCHQGNVELAKHYVRQARDLWPKGQFQLIDDKGLAQRLS